jgi:hypothetical protein
MHSPAHELVLDLCLGHAAGAVAQNCASTPPSPPAAEGAPNIVLVLTDDMDLLLGSWKPMTKTDRLLGQQGVTATNWFIHTPVCCPSRAGAPRIGCDCRMRREPRPNSSRRVNDIGRIPASITVYPAIYAVSFYRSIDLSAPTHTDTPTRMAAMRMCLCRATHRPVLP